MRRTSACGLLFLVFILVVPAFSTGYVALAKGPGPATADSTAVLLGQGPRPAIRPPVRQSLSQSPGLPSQDISTNWSGYVVSSDVGLVTDVNGSWIVPSVSCSGFRSYSVAFWVGIDGWNSSTVEQTGTETDCQFGTPIYYAWYEFYPSASVLISTVTISPGDVISAGVSCQTGGLQCTVSITDVGSGQSFSHSKTFRARSAPQMSSAEWIAEAPSLSSGRPIPLADFGTVYFGQDSTGVASSGYAAVNGVSEPIGSFGAAAVEITMVTQQGSTEAQPSGLSNDGTSFSVAWGSESGAAVSPNATLSAGAITPGSPTIEIGGSIQLTANPWGGTPPYGITWYTAAGVGKCSTSDVSVSTGPTFTPLPTASTYYCYIVTDSAQTPASADSLTDLVTVGSALAYPTISVSPGTIVSGESALISATTAFTGGTSPYTCQWLEEPPSVTTFSDLGSSFTTGCTPSSKPSASTGVLTTSGTWAFELQVTDELGNTVVSPPATLSVSTPGLKLSCSPTSVVVGSATDCEATVQGSGPVPTGVVTWSRNGTGKFSKLTCSLSKAACSVKFTPTAAGSVILTASYGGDSENVPSAGTYGLAATMATTNTAVTCTPKSAVAGSSTVITCKAKVTGYSPIGMVGWSQSGTGSVSLDSISCILSKGTCYVTATGYTGGQVIMNATYAGDSSNQGSSRTAALTVKKASTTVTASCAQSSIGVGTNITCTAMVSGGYTSHNGTITWSKVSGKGSVNFSSTTCVLPSVSCSVTVTATTAGSVKIEAAYGGDSNNQVSSRTTKLTITGALTSTTSSCTEASFSVGTPITCTATVSGGYPPQTGTVIWSKVSGTGKITFSSKTCTLSSGSCSVTVTATTAGTVKIKAAYGGDSNNLKSSGTLIMTII